MKLKILSIALMLMATPVFAQEKQEHTSRFCVAEC